MSAAGAKQDTTVLQSVSVRAEVQPGVFRVVVTDPATLAAWRAARPATARLRFYPCLKALGQIGRAECLDQQITINYP